MENLLVPATLIGAASSVLIELFKFIPALAKTDLRKQITSFVVTLGMTFYFISTESNGDFVAVFLYSLAIAYATYKTILKGITSMLGLSARLKEI